MKINKFHCHLDICERCRNNPFNLCEVGAKLLRQSAKDIFAETFPETETYFNKKDK